MVQRLKQSDADTAVLLCDCGKTLRGYLDFGQLEKKLGEISTVQTVKICSIFCQAKECLNQLQDISGKSAKRLVIAACSREVFDKALCQAMAKYRLNDGLLGTVNIREHCAWVHSNKKEATGKALGLISSAIRRLGASEAVESRTARVNPDVLVFGAGIAGLQTAVELSRLGHKVTLINKHKQLGGIAAAGAEFYRYLASDKANAGSIVKRTVTQLVEDVTTARGIKLYTQTSLRSVTGEFGNFTCTVNSNGSQRQITVGAVVLAVGSACDFFVEAVGLKNPATTIDIMALHRRICSGNIPSRIAIVMDLLSEQGLAVSGQVLSAAEILIKRFGAKVKLYCNNIRVAAAGLENLYRRARDAGLMVAKSSSKPTISEQGMTVFITARDEITGVQLSEEFDLVVIADAVRPTVKNSLASSIKGLRPGHEAALQADNIWLLPIDTNRKGIFVIGGARGNSEFRKALTDGLAVANKIHNLLAEKRIKIFDDAAVVDSDKCVLCLTCMRICPHGAISIDNENKAASVSVVSCQRCGICAAECPAGAIQLTRYTDEQTKAELGEHPQVTVFACENSAYPAAVTAGLGGFEYDSRVQLIRVPCAGKVDSRDVLTALRRGAERVAILGCHPESCQYLSGSSRAEKRTERIQAMLEQAGFDRSRVFFGGLAAVEPGKFIEYIKE